MAVAVGDRYSTIIPASDCEKAHVFVDFLSRQVHVPLGLALGPWPLGRASSRDKHDQIACMASSVLLVPSYCDLDPSHGANRCVTRAILNSAKRATSQGLDLAERGFANTYGLRVLIRLAVHQVRSGLLGLRLAHAVRLEYISNTWSLHQL